MKSLKILLFLLVSMYSYAQKKSVCFTIDDLPVVDYGILSKDAHLALSQKLMEGLSQKQIPAIGFVNEGKMYDSKGGIIAYQKACLQMWVDAGMDLGNHTLNHKDFNNTDFNVYTDEILKGEKITEALLKNVGKELKYFRHPYLHIGATQQRADSLSAFLKKHKYTLAPVTIDNDDYLFASAYAKALKKQDGMLAQKIGADYISYMEQKVLYYEKQSEALFGRQIAQTLLIHASQLNADYILKLAAIFEKHDYAFASLESALKDEAYNTPITKFGKYGISWIDRWAISQGKKGEFFKGDPQTPQYIVELNNTK